MNKILLCTIICLFLLSCDKSKPPAFEISTTERDQVIVIGQEASTELIRGLILELGKALKEKKASGAIEFCSKEALPLTSKIQKKLKEGVKLKRTSAKYRNPKNKPDKYEEEVLRHFVNKLAVKEKVGENYIQKIAPDGKVEYRYYRTLYVGPLCLQCHGNDKQISSEVQKALKEKYPKDKARNYEEGDFRGLIRVSIPENLITKK